MNWQRILVSLQSFFYFFISSYFLSVAQVYGWPEKQGIYCQKLGLKFENKEISENFCNSKCDLLRGGRLSYAKTQKKGIDTTALGNVLRPFGREKV